MNRQWIVPTEKTLLVIVLILLSLPANVYAAAPNDEDYNDDAGFTSSSSQFTLDGIKYTLTGTPDTVVTNQGAGSGGSSLGNDGADYYISIYANSVKIEAADGSYFKLNGFTMDVYADANVTIAPSSGTPLTRTCNGSILVENVNVSGNTDFQYITSVTFSGSNMLLNLDDLDFSPPVPPTYTVTYNGNGNTGGSAPTDGS
ncbi:MAG TPA: hypothetical protein PKH07_19130, partial [bacterium]|nr:hypothetical protein [bacterium]